MRSKLLTNAVTFASNKGYIGELVGSLRRHDEHSTPLSNLWVWSRASARQLSDCRA